MADITLNAGMDPTPSPLTVTNGESITITNNLGAEVLITMSHAGLFNPSTGTSLTVSSSGWTGTVGATSGTYQYVEPGRKREPRNGTINVGD